MSQSQDYASGYARAHRMYEWGGISLAAALFSTLAVKLVASGTVSGWWVPLTVFAGLMGADFTSGVVHWLFDTWGSVNTPVVGQLAIRTFREHHVDERAMTRHGFVETNGHNITLTVIPSTIGIVALRYPCLASTLVAMSGLSMGVCVGMTSQIHKWAHMDQVPRLVRKMQDLGLIIGARHHDRHHRKPHDSYYCITVGWMNAPLEAIGFFKHAERAITRLTGAHPREEDLVATASLPEPAPLPPEPEAQVAMTPKVAAPADVS